MNSLAKITILGDALCDYEMSRRLQLYRDERGKYDFHSVFTRLKSFLRASDFVIANLETPISRNDEDLTNSLWRFNSPYEFAQALHDCGVHCVSTANNHCLDRGMPGVESTIRSLDEIGLQHFGTRMPGEKARPLICEVKGIRIGLLSFTYGTNAVTNHQYLSWKNRHVVDLLQEQEGWSDKWNLWKQYARKRPGGRIAKLWNQLDLRMHPENEGKEWFEQCSFASYRLYLARKQISWLKRQKVDLILVQLHVGGQYNQEPSAYTKKMVDWFLREGCDVVIGNHEHVVHGFRYDPATKQIGTYAIGNLVGSAGTLTPPYDRYADCSIALHVYVDMESKKIAKYTYSVLKTTADAQERLYVEPVEKKEALLGNNESGQEAALETIKATFCGEYQIQYEPFPSITET